MAHPAHDIAPSQPPQRLPRWLKAALPAGGAAHLTARLLDDLRLATVCQHARCPNRPECYSQRTATFMILGSICTRGCRFCSVGKGTPLPVDPEEPQRVAQAATQLGLRHVVITSVTRDDLPDGGAEHFYRTILAVRAATGASVEVLPSDFAGNLAAVDRVLEAAPDVYNYNCETVPRLYPVVRTAAASYRRTLAIFRHIARHSPAVRRKTGLMLGLGETVGELLDTLAELHESGCQMLTLGQYLRPSPAQLPVARYVPPEEFDQLGELARRIGYRPVASGPLVRSSYHAGTMVAQS